MICALMLGREGSQGFPGKNVYPVLGRPLMVYPLLAAKSSTTVDQVFVSTDSPRIREIAVEHGALVIDRPAELCTPEALGEDAFVHGYQFIKSLPANQDESIELMVLLFCNAATITPEIIDEGVRVLRGDPQLDSAVSVSRYNMWSPLRARRIGPDGTLEPFVPLEALGDPQTLSCDRDSQGDVYFADCGVSIVRPKCLESIEEGLLPQRWMGRKIYPLIQWGGCDVDYEWQIPSVEFWLTKHGYKHTREE